MKHLGSVCDINGAEIEPVDIISFGSPCQDLSVAGKRAGLQGSRSSLFLEAIRIIKEMREATNGIYPRFAIWENVPGAFSSHGGEDFHAVLNEFLHIVNTEATIPAVGKDGWSTADVYVGDGWSIAYRILNAAAWGVAQRRRRIYLVADFRGESAGKILFEREGLRRNPPKSIEAWQGIAGTVAESVGTADQYLFHTIALDKYNQQATEEVSPTLKTVNGGDDIHCVVVENHPADSRCNIDDSGTVQTLTGRMGTGGNNTPMVMFSKSARGSADDATTWKESQVTNTLTTFDVGEVRTNEIVTYCIGNGQRDSAHHMSAEKTGALDCMHDQKAIISYQSVTGTLSCGAHPGGFNGQDAYNDMLVTSVDCRNATEDTINGSLQHDSYKSLNSNNVCRQGHIVRRLTPLECCRLQGFPDGFAKLKPYSDDDYQFWNSIHPGTPAQVQRWYNKLHTDSAEYKMWGNGIALPCALYVFEGIEEEIRLAHESPDVAK